MDILIVEDETVVARQLEETLHQEAYKTVAVGSVAGARHAMQEQNFDLILLDWNLPDGDGITLLHDWREQKIPIPVLVLSANITVDDRVHALNTGADDYLCKPHSSIELLARVRALLRRDAPLKTSKLSADDVVVDIIARDVSVAGTPVKLSLAEFDLLTLLMQHQGIVLTRFQLNEHISKDFDRISVSNLIDVHIRNIRRKLDRPELIQTVRGVGYTIKT
ncbi:response regulator transcription factor [Sulfurimonas sp. HSL-1656]|uniref:response regulator transcription factor n=1 Tax=Thiomicrolovo subterrani TaxID=3131934 RepID=UPI0031F7C97E